MAGALELSSSFYSLDISARSDGRVFERSVIDLESDDHDLALFLFKRLGKTEFMGDLGLQSVDMFNSSNYKGFEPLNARLKLIRDKLKNEGNNTVGKIMRTIMKDASKDSLGRFNPLPEELQLACHRGFKLGVPHLRLADMLNIDDSTILGRHKKINKNFVGLYKPQVVRKVTGYKSDHYEKLYKLYLNTLKIEQVEVFCQENGIQDKFEEIKTNHRKMTKVEITKQFEVPSTVAGHLTVSVQDVYNKYKELLDKEKKKQQLEEKKAQRLVTMKRADGSKYCPTFTKPSDTERNAMVTHRDSLQPNKPRIPHTVQKHRRRVLGPVKHILTPGEEKLVENSIIKAVSSGESFAKIAEDNWCTIPAVKLVRDKMKLTPEQQRKLKTMQQFSTIESVKATELIKKKLWTMFRKSSLKSKIQQVYGDVTALLLETITFPDDVQHIFHQVKQSDTIIQKKQVPLSLLSLLIKIVCRKYNFNEQAKCDTNLVKLLVKEEKPAATIYNHKGDLYNTTVVDKVKAIWEESQGEPIDIPGRVFYSKTSKSFVYSRNDGRGTYYKSLCTEKDCWLLGRYGSNYKNRTCFYHHPDYCGRTFAVRDLKNPQYKVFVTVVSSFASKPATTKSYAEKAIQNVEKSTEYLKYMESVNHVPTLKIVYGPLIATKLTRVITQRETLKMAIISHFLIKNGTKVELECVDHPLVNGRSVQLKLLDRELLWKILGETGNHLLMLNYKEFKSWIKQMQPENEKLESESFLSMLVRSGQDCHVDDAHKRISLICTSRNCTNWKLDNDNMKDTRISIYGRFDSKNGVYIGLNAGTGRNEGFIVPPGSGSVFILQQNPGMTIQLDKTMTVVDEHAIADYQTKEREGVKSEGLKMSDFWIFAQPISGERLYY